MATVGRALLLAFLLMLLGVAAAAPSARAQDLDCPEIVYDCSGAVSFALIRTGHLRSSLTSGGFARWGSRGKGRWVTIYANRGHVYMEVAGLRFDTSAVADAGGRKGARWRPAIGRRKGFKVRRPAGL